MYECIGECSYIMDDDRVCLAFRGTLFGPRWHWHRQSRPDRFGSQIPPGVRGPRTTAFRSFLRHHFHRFAPSTIGLTGSKPCAITQVLGVAGCQGRSQRAGAWGPRGSVVPFAFYPAVSQRVVKNRGNERNLDVMCKYTRPPGYVFLAPQGLDQEYILRKQPAAQVVMEPSPLFNRAYDLNFFCDVCQQESTCRATFTIIRMIFKCSNAVVPYL